MGQKRQEPIRDHRKQPREKRTRHHPEEWAMDLRKYLDQNGGKITGTQTSLAKKLKMPLRSLKVLLTGIKAGKYEGLSAIIDAGRRGSTTLESKPLNGPISDEKGLEA